MEEKIKIHPLNLKGKYYVDQESCLIHGCCEDSAPNNFKLIEIYNSDDFGAYVFKQPATLEEEQQCQRAKDCCPMQAIYNDGI